MHDLSDSDLYETFKDLYKYFTTILGFTELAIASFPDKLEIEKILESDTLKEEVREFVELMRKVTDAIIPNPSRKIMKRMRQIAMGVRDQDGLLRPSNLMELLGMCWLENARFLSFEQKSIGIRDAILLSCIDLLNRKPAIYLPTVCFDHYEATEADLTLSITNIPLIDTEKAKWDQILEFRKDKESRKKLRNFWLFLHTNYEGKTRPFIEDDLNKRLDDYQNACRDWGFDTLTSTISALLDAKNLIGLLAGSTCATLFGGPIAGLVTFASIELSKIAITVAKERHAFHKLKRDHELAYIIEARKRLLNC